MHLNPTSIPGCFEIQFTAYSDHRGVFVKTTAASHLKELGLECGFIETFHSLSHQNVLRGMHLQVPPADHAKLVYLVSGEVMDVALDLRCDSPTYGQFAVIELSHERHNAVYFPRGVAHGFYVRQGPAVMCYHVTSEHTPACDVGVAWDSFGAPWPVADPVISARDSAFAPLSRFESPFGRVPALSQIG